MQEKRMELPLTRVRWLQEMGIAPAMLRAHIKQPTSAQPEHKKTAPLPSLSERLAAESKTAKTQLTTPVQPRPMPTPASVEPATDLVPAARAIKAEDYPSWCQAVQSCEGCARSGSRVQVFTGVGVSQQPEWFVLGSAPTRQDEAAAQAWQSAAGQLLYAQLQAIGLTTEQQIYCSYALKCYAPAPTPSADEINACRGVFLQELAFVQPKRLLLLGQSAVEMVFGAQAKLSELRGTVQQWQPAEGEALPVVIGADPASLLLRPQQKAQAWLDLLLMRSLMEQS